MKCHTFGYNFFLGPTFDLCRQRICYNIIGQLMLIQGQTVQEDDKASTMSVHLGRVVGEVHMKDIWVDSAEILMRQGFYQPAREMLNEAHLACSAFDDASLRAKVLYLLGKDSIMDSGCNTDVAL